VVGCVLKTIWRFLSPESWRCMKCVHRGRTQVVNCDGGVKRALDQRGEPLHPSGGGHSCLSIEEIAE
jgi:hypothetical protein